MGTRNKAVTRTDLERAALKSERTRNIFAKHWGREGDSIDRVFTEKKKKRRSGGSGIEYTINAGSRGKGKDARGKRIGR